MSSLKQLNNCSTANDLNGCLSATTRQSTFIAHSNNDNKYTNSRAIPTSTSLNKNLNNIYNYDENYLIETRAFPYHQNQKSNFYFNSNRQLNKPAAVVYSSHENDTNNINSSSCKIYQDMEDYNQHFDEFKSHPTEFKGHLV